MTDSQQSEFVAQYEAVKHKLLTFLVHRVNYDRALAEDLMMDVVLKAYEHYNSFDAVKGSFKNWIFTIAHNHLKNFWRAGKHVPDTSLDTLAEEGFEPSIEGAETDAISSIEQRNVARVMTLLTDSEREIISLKYLQEFTNEEIAKMTERNEGAVRTQLSRALERFKEIYQKLYPQKTA